MTTKELQQEIVSNMKRWQEIEKACLVSASRMVIKTDNPVVRLIMEIIHRDSQMHCQIEKCIADSIEHHAVSLTPEELGEAWEVIEHHMELEKKSMEIAEQTLASLKGKKMLVQDYLLNYLLEDERKHDSMLSRLEDIKRGMYPRG